MNDQITTEQVQNYLSDNKRRDANRAKTVRAYEGETADTLDNIIREILIESEVMPVTNDQLLSVEKLEVGSQTKFSIFNIKRIS